MILLAFTLLSCAPEPSGLLATPEGDGPMVRIDYDAEPIADIPFPNDLATRVDPTSPTGLRLNIATESVTRLEEEAREKLNTLTGFGVYTPISVSFEARIDIDDFQTRHKLDERYGDARYSDDAIFLLNVDPNSDSYLSFVELDIGEGRYPVDVANPDRYFENDPRAGDPSLLFESTDEDINANGVLDAGEDTDNDGVLDSPNVWPTGGDPRDDLLDWYNLQSNTLIARPVVPLDEETTYAVVLTDRIIGESSGEPVRSPWEWVHHTSQTAALEPVGEALAEVGLSLENVAFAWTYTTGRITGDLVDIQLGLQGTGPYFSLAADYPVGVTEAHVMHSLTDTEDVYRLPISTIMDTLVELDFFDEDDALVLNDYETFASDVVGGAFTTPFFMLDSDGDNSWHDESFRLDPFTGEMAVEAQRVPFTCVLPKASDTVVAPFPTVIYGHGYGGSRFEFLAFAHAFNRMGMAACGNDAPGHGPTVSESELALIEVILEQKGLYEFYDHLLDARHRDLDNDGTADSGDDQWSADAFHTRDMVRQAAVDWMWMVESLRACGEGEMEMQGGGTRVSCDWNDDGVNDIGGPDGEVFIIGGSLGGINAGVAAGVIPNVSAWVPVVSGAGLLDIGTRTEIGGAVEAMVGRLISPFFIGRPGEAEGALDIIQIVNSNTKMHELHVATISDFPAGGSVTIENLSNGEVRQGMIPDDGRFRVAIAADALDAIEKAAETVIVAGMPVAVEDTTLLGDSLMVTIRDSEGNTTHEIDSWESNVTHDGVIFGAGQPLIAGNEGFGHIRGTPEVGRVTRVFASIIEGGDPAAYAPYYQSGHPDLNNGPQNVLIAPSIGDTIVNVATGIAHARAAGYLDRHQADDRWGMSEDQFLIDRRVVQGLEEWGPYENSAGEAILFDPDDLEEEFDIFEEPSDEPLRATVDTETGQSGMRLFYISPFGTHGFGVPDVSRAYDMNTYAIFTAATYFHDRGQVIRDDTCLADASCEWIPALPWTNQATNWGIGQ